MLSEYSNSLNTPLYPTVPYCFNVLKSSIAAFAFGKGFSVFGILKYAPDDLLSLQVVLLLPLFPYVLELFPHATQGAIPAFLSPVCSYTINTTYLYEMQIPNSQINRAAFSNIGVGVFPASSCFLDTAPTMGKATIDSPPTT